MLSILFGHKKLKASQYLNYDYSEQLTIFVGKPPDQFLISRFWLAAMLLFLVMLVNPSAVHSKVNENRFWVDNTSGFALSGYDPVAYFSDNRARLGEPGLEHRWQGVVWRFANEGNLAAFVANPGIYAPKFGAYGTTSLARGFITEASPHHWKIYKGQLYLFFSPIHMRIFSEQPDEIINAAAHIWKTKKVDY